MQNVFDAGVTREGPLTWGAATDATGLRSIEAGSAGAVIDYGC